MNLVISDTSCSTSKRFHKRPTDWYWEDLQGCAEQTLIWWLLVSFNTFLRLPDRGKNSGTNYAQHLKPFDGNIHSTLKSYFDIRWWKCQPARRDVPQRQTSTRVQEEANDRVGHGRGPPEPNLQDSSSTRRFFVQITSFFVRYLQTPTDPHRTHKCI